jgi:hypothetical protein
MIYYILMNDHKKTDELELRTIQNLISLHLT